MTGPVVAACLVLAALTLGWPARTRGRRLRPPGVGSAARWAGPLHPARALLLIRGGPHPGVVAVGAGLAGVALGGPVAALVAAAYATAGVVMLRRHRSRQAADHARVRAIDRLGELAADLRAGAPVGTAWAGPAPGAAPVGDRTIGLAGAAVRLADQTGAPLAELVDRLVADARAVDRIRATAAAQSAGTQATAIVLAALPAGGIALGYAIGADPLAVLLGTPLGAGCAVAALGLQLAGVAWTDRIARHIRSAT